MKHMIALALVFATLVSCSTQKTDQVAATSDLTPDAYGQWTGSQVLDPVADRKPSSDIVGRVTHVWEADTIKVAMKQNGSYDKQVRVNFAQYALYTTIENRPVVVQKWVTVGWVSVSKPVLVCTGTTTEGTGKSVLWNDYFGAPKAQKPMALAKAITGVGEPTAKKLIAAGYFSSKPRSWDDFSDVIKGARARGVIDETIEYNVLFKYRSDNLSSLGYESSVGSTCVTRTETYLEPVQELRNVTEYQLQNVPHKDLINQEARMYRVYITGPRLQSFETEVITINPYRNINGISFTVSGDDYTEYVKTISSDTMRLNGIARKAVRLPSDVFIGGAALEASNGRAGFVATVNPRYIPKTATEGQLLLSLELRSCKRGSFGGCSILNRNEQLVVKTSMAVAANGVVRYQFARDPSRYYYAKYWVNLAGSPWYVNNVVVAPRRPGL